MFSIVTPLDANRLKQFHNTKLAYDAMPEVKEFLIPTRSFREVSEYLHENNLMKDARLIPYDHEKGFNPSKALNLGVKNASYDNIIITSPEVKPKTNVLEQLTAHIGENIVCQVFDQNEEGEEVMSLVNKSYRSDTPAMYFLAMFNKADIEVINGWDEDFMRGYAYEDNDFGARWVRAGLPFRVINEIQAVHQYHPRSETIHGGSAINMAKYHENTDKGVISPLNGLTKH
jgi:hypothetical protein